MFKAAFKNGDYLSMGINVLVSWQTRQGSRVAFKMFVD